ncbi:class I SAM-dependent methyltransferase [Clostridium taeniosporum]|uniref:SAM-dependent methyltransferase n=1 Tax=Clostridium taeniosporum TaxID=394958 RepID=A0A1D7XKL1_9CLOT|nr:class I SAM-dependent methyltransferase [Clostridium taeniosporum]AOR23866.1 SAM-dependent methyltransferase [Clostridium taeniosporum]
MEYIGNKKYWDDKFASRSDNVLSPERSIVENLTCFKKGSVLDIACGDGRNALYLLENGFKVTGVDFSSKALERLRNFAKRSNYFVNTRQIDLSVSNSLKNIGIFDNVLINHYRLNKKQFLDIENQITEGGILFICGFGHKHPVDSKIRNQDLIQQEDFQYINKSFNLIKYIESEEDRGFFVTYIYRKY